MTPRYGSAIDGPGGDPVAVVNLLEPSVAVGEDILYGCCVSGGIIGVGFERLDHSSDAARCDACGNEGVRIVQRQQARFNADATSKVIPGQAARTCRSVSAHGPAAKV
jgi:hypothetical protein